MKDTANYGPWETIPWYLKWLHLDDFFRRRVTYTTTADNGLSKTWIRWDYY